MKKFYFSFGVSMAYRKKFVLIHADDRAAARHMMHKCHGDRWAFDYSDTEWHGTSMSNDCTLLAEFRQDDPSIDWEF